MKYISRDRESVQVAVSDNFCRKFMSAKSSFTEALNDFKQYKDDDTSHNKEKEVALEKLNSARTNYKNYIAIVKDLEKEAKEQLLLQETKAEDGNSFGKGKFTKDFKRQGNVALDAVGVVLLMVVSSTVLFATLLFTTGTALLLLLASMAIVSMTLLAGDSLLKRKEKYHNLENRMLKNRMLEEKLQKQKNRRQEYMSEQSKLHRDNKEVKVSNSVLSPTAEKKDNVSSKDQNFGMSDLDGSLDGSSSSSEEYKGPVDLNVAHDKSVSEQQVNHSASESESSEMLTVENLLKKFHKILNPSFLSKKNRLII